MAHHIEARFDEEDSTFVPPLRTLGFNQNLTMNDSLLVQSYIECYDISYPEALRRIEDEVSELRQHLQAEGEYELNDIGMLSLNSEGSIEFHPCEAGILTPGLYGLGTFAMEPLKKADSSMSHPETLSAVQAEESVMDGQMQDADTQTADADTREEAEDGENVTEEPERVIVIKMSWLRNAVAVAAAVLAFFMIGTPVSNSNLGNGIQQSSIIPLSTTNVSMAQDEDTAFPTADIQTETSAEETPSPSVEVPNVQPTEEYCIVLASQVSQKNADDFVELLGKSGFSDAYLTNKKFRRVVYGHYATKEDAMAQLRQLRQQSRKFFGEGWVMRIDN